MTEFNEEIIHSDKFGELIESALRVMDGYAFPAAEFYEPLKKVDWNLALFLVSALDKDGASLTNQAVMDICFGALQATDTTEDDRAAASLLLERFGNRPSTELAIKRQLVPSNYRTRIPATLRFDSISSELEFRIEPLFGDAFVGSQFQKAFWESAENNEWLSLSAPTSTGKSYVVKRWVIDAALRNDNAVVLYVVPTRALVDEVSRELSEEAVLAEVRIHAVPWDSTLEDNGPRVLVMTQERLQMAFDKAPALLPTAAFFDEAQKMGDGYRGVLLEGVLTEALRRNPDLEVVFASPMTKNPEELLSRAVGGVEAATVDTPIPNVNQHLYWVDPKPQFPKTWVIKRSVSGEMVEVAEIELDRKITRVREKQALIPYVLANPESLNIIYVNRPTDAEACAEVIYGAITESEMPVDQRIRDVQELIEKSVHPEYSLSRLLSRGVAFHYGSMPQSVREAVEALYRDGFVKFLICTSTLLEGVNLPCTNIWIMNPKRGIGTPMEPFDFWNLAGRAGRWGTEFAGNIICIDTNTWDSTPPTARTNGVVSFATEKLLESPQQITSLIASNGEENRSEDYEALAAHLFDAASRGETPKAFRKLTEVDADELTQLLREKEAELRVPESVRRSHPGINPQDIQRLYERLSEEDASTLKILPPHDEGAYHRLVTILDLCEETMNAGFGSTLNRRRIAVFLQQWMQGWSVPSIIASRYAHETKNSEKRVEWNSIIRQVLSDLEQVARYRAPKYLACYMDIVAHLSPEITGEAARVEVSAMLEFGVSKQTQVSLMSLGFSRISTLKIAEAIGREDLDVPAVVRWLSTANLEQVELPVLLRDEVERVAGRVLRGYRRRSD